MTTERSSEISSPYAAQPAATSAAAPVPVSTEKPFDLDTVKKVRTVHLAQAKATGQKFSMLTCYDALTAQIFDRAGIDMLLVGDSAANVVLGYESTLT
ncbi:MAG: 3-methyl-2-oxobutanoate hydroxymethyltransferase, partial [Rothia mucilaginosa]